GRGGAPTARWTRCWPSRERTDVGPVPGLPAHPGHGGRGRRAEGVPLPAALQLREVPAVVLPQRLREAAALAVAHEAREGLRPLRPAEELDQRHALGVERSQVTWVRIVREAQQLAGAEQRALAAEARQVAQVAL